MKTVVKVVDGTKKEVYRIKTDVKQHGEKLENLTEVVEKTVEKVEVIDHKVTNYWNMFCTQGVRDPGFGMVWLIQ